MKNYRKTKNCNTCLYCQRYNEIETRRVGERLYQEYYTYFCSKGVPADDIEGPAIMVCDDWEAKE